MLEKILELKLNKGAKERNKDMCFCRKSKIMQIGILELRKSIEEINEAIYQAVASGSYMNIDWSEHDSIKTTIFG